MIRRSYPKQSAFFWHFELEITQIANVTAQNANVTAQIAKGYY